MQTKHFMKPHVLITNRKLINTCNNKATYITHVGTQEVSSWYLYTHVKSTAEYYNLGNFSTKSKNSSNLFLKGINHDTKHCKTFNLLSEVILQISPNGKGDQKLLRTLLLSF